MAETERNRNKGGIRSSERSKKQGQTMLDNKKHEDEDVNRSSDPNKRELRPTIRSRASKTREEDMEEAIECI